MKRFKKISVLLGILVAISIITFIVTQTEEKKEQIKNSGDIVLDIPGDKVKSLSWSYGETTLAFHKDEKWLYDDDEAFPVDEEKIAKLLSEFEELGASFVIENVEDYSQYGLDDPVCTIKLTDGEKSYEVLIGGYSKMDSQRYLSIGDGNVYLVKTDPFESYEVKLSDLIENDTVPFFGYVTGVQFYGSEGYKIFYEQDSKNTYCSEDVYFTTVNNKTVPLDTTNVESYVGSINSLNLSNYVSYNATDEELAAYGLDNPELTVTVNYTSEDYEDDEKSQVFTLNVGRNQKELKALEKAVAAGEDSEITVTAYARVGESKIIYKISEAEYNALVAASYNDLRHKEVFTADLADITQIDVSLENNSYSITSEISDNNDGDRVFSYKGEEIDITDLSSKVQGLEADSFTEEEPIGKEEISLTFHLNNENYPKIHVILYRYDGTNCLAVVDGEPICLVSRSSVVDLIEAINSILLG